MLEMDVELSLDHFDLSAALALDSPVTALFGPNGSGKSALLAMMAGRLNPQRGWIKFGGETLVDTRRGIRVPASRRRIGLVDQEPMPRSRGPVLANLRSAQIQAAAPVGPERFDEIIRLLELEPLLDADTHALCAEEEQRMAVARALMASPRLLLLDEPQSSDLTPAPSGILPFLTRVREALRLPVIYVSRSLGDILRITDKMVLMANGRILGVGDVHEIVTDRILLAATALQGIENVLPVTILAHDAEDGCTLARHFGTELVLPMAPELAKGTVARVVIRSSDIVLSKRHLNGISIQNQIKGRVCAVIRTPEHAVVQVDCGSTLLAGVSLRALKQMDLQEGDGVYCLIKAHAFFYLEQEEQPPSTHMKVSTTAH